MIISQAILAMLIEQMEHELANQMLYNNLATLAEYHGLDNTAELFNKQACDEKSHFNQVKKYIEDRNEKATIGMVQIPEIPSNGYAELFVTSLERERSTTEKLQSLAMAAFSEVDLMTYHFIMGMIAEQVEEENLFQTILDRINVRNGASEMSGMYQSQDSMDLDGAVVHDIDVWIGSL